MLFFPFRVDLELRRIPWVTLLVCLVCTVIFVKQLHSQARYSQAVGYFCNNALERSTRLVLARFRNTQLADTCASIFTSLRDAHDRESRYRELTSMAKNTHLFASEEQERKYINKKLRVAYRDFESLVPENLTDKYAFDPQQSTFTQMFTSIFSHGSWSHLIFNLLFFYAFAASVEVIAGSLMYAGIIFFLTISTNIAYTLASGGSGLPTVGLSGVVMGMMALLATTAPTIRIRCLLWFLLYIKILRVPALLLALWFVGWDIYNIQTVAHSQTNYVAHISGALTGALIGGFYWLRRADYLRELVPGT